MVKRSIEFDMKVKEFIFSDEVLLRGTFRPPSEFTKVQFQHFIDLLSYNLINTRERKIRFHFRLVMRPDIGEINFDGEFNEEDALDLTQKVTAMCMLMLKKAGL